METVWSLTKKLTSDKKMSIPLKFLGYDRENYRFVITGVHTYPQAGEVPGIYAHSYVHHSDGASLTLYCFLRHGGLDPATAYAVTNLGLDGANLKFIGNNYYLMLSNIVKWAGKWLVIKDPEKEENITATPPDAMETPPA